MAQRSDAYFMRIIGGIYKGHPIEVLKKFNGRPTTDFAREGLMNILYHMVDMDGIRVLDLFSGTGALGLECFSRGASFVTSIEQQATHVMHIKKNHQKFEVKGLVVKADCLVWLKQNTTTYELILADPPFDLVQMKDIPNLCQSALSEEGLLVLEHGKEHDFESHPAFIKMKKFGHVHFSFFKKLIP
jgi:16S rRNA (guanine966-N2)-methyltransferase